MPRRGSKAHLYKQLVHFFAQEPIELFDHYSRMPVGEVRKLAAAHAAQHVRTPGRPKRGSRYDALARQVDKVLKSGLRKTKRGACSYVAEKAGVSAAMVRKRYQLLFLPN